MNDPRSTVLVVDDDPKILLGIRVALETDGHRVVTAADGRAALAAVVAHDPDAVVLDLTMPLLDGIGVCTALRAAADPVPIIMLTARDRSAQRIEGLDAGADDYLGKPFDLAEVEARLRALVRRAKGTEDIVLLGQLKLDRKARRFSTAGGPLDLPAREFEVLWELMSPPGRTVSKRALSDKLSSFDESLGDNALEAFISRLRKKLQGTGAGIRTLRGIGYLLEAEV